MTILYFILSLGILVLAHEWGHFIIARKSGITVKAFSIGFGPVLFKTKPGETEYRISLIPLGGYVQLYGEDPLAEAEGDKELAEKIAASPNAFSKRPILARLATVVAGPTMNIILALLIMPAAFFVGRSEPTYINKPPVIMGVKENSPAQTAGLQKGDQILALNGQEVKTWDDFLYWVALHPNVDVKLKYGREETLGDTRIQTEIPFHVALSPLSSAQVGYSGVEPYLFIGEEAIVGNVMSDGAAAQGGLKPGDKVKSINGHPVASWTDMTQTVRESAGKSLDFEVRREGTLLHLTITPHLNEGIHSWMIGVTQYQNPGDSIKQRYSLSESFRRGFHENMKLFQMTGAVLKQIVHLQVSYKNFEGPVQIAQVSAAAARSGLGDFLYFMAFLSLQLGVMNLLPIPVLDGGHVIFIGFEGIFRRPFPAKLKTAFQYIGLAFLLTFITLVTINDVNSVWGWAHIWGKIKGIF